VPRIDAFETFCHDAGAGLGKGATPMRRFATLAIVLGLAASLLGVFAFSGLSVRAGAMAGQPRGGQITILSQATESDVSCALAKNEHPTVPTGLDTAETVAVGIQNVGGAQDVDVELRLVSPLACPAEWDAATVPSGGVVEPPEIIGPNQLSDARWAETGMGASELRTRNVDYIVNCSASPPTYPFQIVEDVSGASLDDPNPMNNTCENHPVVTGTGSGPVGGIAELPAVVESDWPARNFMALAGLATTALIALTAGAWYARRRWGR